MKQTLASSVSILGPPASMLALALPPRHHPRGLVGGRAASALLSQLTPGRSPP